MADDATLMDVTVSPNPQNAAVAAEPVAEPAVAAPSPEDAEAMEVGRLLIGSGFSKAQVNDVLQAPGALVQLRHLINENPQELINLLDRSNPDASKKLLDTAADEYVKRYGKDAPAGKKDDPNSGLMAEVESLRNQLNQFQSRAEQERNAVAMASIQARYNARVTDLFAQLPKDTALTSAETKALTARVNAELAADPTVVQRVAAGNFVDVPHKFKAVIDEWASDRKAAATASDKQRKGVSDNANAEFLGGPNPFLPTNTDFANSWDDTEVAFAKALNSASR
jgi:hypothetical protein